MRKKRHDYTPEEKVSILRRHLIDRVPISDQQLEEKLQRKHEVLSELVEEHIKLKKELGEL